MRLVESVPISDGLIFVRTCTHKTVKVLGGRLNKDIKAFFINQYSVKDRAAVQRVVMDMNAAYQLIVHELFPNAPNAQHTQYLFGLNEYSTEQNAIDLGTSVSPTFKDAYDTYLDVHDALMGGQCRKLETLITTYKRNGSVLDTAMTTLRKNLRGVINAAKSSYSNGPIEGVNRKIKELKRSCYGFANQANMFKRVYQLTA